MKIEDFRSPEICQKEILRGIANNNPSKWGMELLTAMRKVADGETIDFLNEGASLDAIARMPKRGLHMRKYQEVQLGHKTNPEIKLHQIL